MNRRMSWGHYVLEGGAYGFQVNLIDHRKEKTRGRLLTGIPPGLRCAYGRLRISYADDMTRMAWVKPWVSTLGTGRIYQPRTLPTSKFLPKYHKGSYCPSKTNFLSPRWHPESLRQLAQFLCVVTQKCVQVNAAKLLLAPIRLLPTENLTLIFELCMTNKILDNRRSMRTSFRLTRVCKIWRDIATNTPALWSSAYIDSAQIKSWPLKTLESWTNAISERNHFKGLQVEISTR